MNLNKQIGFFSKIIFWGAKHTLFSCLLSLILALIIGFIVFIVNYRSLSIDGPLGENRNYFDEKAYELLSEFWGEREKRFEEAGYKNYPNPFILTQEEK